MNKEQIAKLKELAQAATPGPWRHDGIEYGDMGHRYQTVTEQNDGDYVVGEYGIQEHDAVFISAANPAAILELIALAERALLAAAPAPIQQEPVAPARQALHTMQYEDGRIGCWYFDCDGHYIDVEKDGAGKYSVYFRDRATGKEGWLDQADSATPPALAGSQVQAAGDMLQPDDLKALQRFFECCEDFDSGGHDVGKERMARLRELGVIQSKGFGRDQITAFGDYVMCLATNTKARFPLKTFAEYNDDARLAHEAKLAAMREQP